MIETANLLIREYDPSDFDELYAILSDPVSMKWWPSPLTVADVRAWMERSMKSYAEHGFGRYGVVLKQAGKLIGDCGIVRAKIGGEIVNDLGYIIDSRYWGKGYAVEAAAAVVEHAFGALGLDALHANMAYDHDASRKVAERIGMRKISEFDNERNRGIRTLLYAIHRGSR